MAIRNFKYSIPPFLAPTISAFTTENTEWPASNALLDAIPKRPWKTTTTGSDQSIVFNFGAATQVGALLINRVNYPSIIVESSTDGASFSVITPAGLTSTANGLTIPVDTEVQRRKIVIDLTGLFNFQYLRLRIKSGLTTDDGANYYSTGGVTVGSTLSMFPGGMQLPLDVSIEEPSIVDTFPSGGEQTNDIGDKKAILELGGSFITNQTKATVDAILAIRQQPMIFWSNIRTTEDPSHQFTLTLDSFDPSQAYLVRRKSQPKKTYPVLPEFYEASFQWAEVI